MRQRYTYIIYILLPLVAIASVAAIVVPARQGGGVDYAQITEPIAEVASAVSTQSVGRKVAAEALEIKSDVAAGDAQTAEEHTSQQREVIAEAVAALSALGFSPAPSQKVAKEILKQEPDAPVERIIKLALKML